MLTRKRLKELLSYDAITGELTWLIAASRRVKVGDIAGFTTKDGGRCLMVDGIVYYRRDLAWLYIYGKWPIRTLFHIDNDSDNIAIANLRLTHPAPEGELTQKYLKQILKYHPTTGLFTWKTVINPGKQVVGDVAGRIISTGYRIIELNGNRYLAHRLVFLYTDGYLPTTDVDHIDRIRDNNRRVNLREVTRSENLRNAKKRKNNTSGVTGVRQIKDTGMWIAHIYANGKTLHLGMFDSIEKATAARLAAEEKYGYHPSHGK